MLGVSTLFYYICSKFLKKCSILRDCMELMKRLKEQKSNNPKIRKQSQWQSQLQ